MSDDLGAVLKDRKIVLGVTGSVAIFKACELTGRLRRAGADVRVVMTLSATRLALPDLFRSLSGNEVATELFGSSLGSNPHVDLAVWADLIVVAPATANVLGKVAAGIADDLLSTLIMAARSAVVFAPAMNTRMWENPVTRENMRKLRGLGYRFVEGEAGWLACGEEGKGRMAEVSGIVEAIGDALAPEPDLDGLTIMITAGRTEEPIDEVRYLSNRSSGKTGLALAREATRRGASVVYVTGASSVVPPQGVEVVNVGSAEEMKEAVLRELPRVDVLVMAAAVADYRPSEPLRGKIKKSVEPMNLSLVPTDDILALAGERRRDDQVLVGFALETQGEIDAAAAKLRKKNLDLVVVNNPVAPDSGFGKDEVRAAILDADTAGAELRRVAKSDLAKELFDRVVGIRRKRG
ncbi:MAG: bifunctional phosphopantothenoylcysteine decarboxylase/phosphopantothenate--cysteine ligase CoaBC [Candidatus Eisenbacteria sp.]|nr:bifunctional phosphopantothenoylcysteine decarboxylase/phosphopantothenate--cysteine ligase CoaBC [Candidatus Eisenbacteria bacterium]